jgi:hypothetical protein
MYTSFDYGLRIDILSCVLKNSCGFYAAFLVLVGPRWFIINGQWWNVWYIIYDHYIHILELPSLRGRHSEILQIVSASC